MAKLMAVITTANFIEENGLTSFSELQIETQKRLLGYFGADFASLVNEAL